MKGWSQSINLCEHLIRKQLGCMGSNAWEVIPSGYKLEFCCLSHTQGYVPKSSFVHIDLQPSMRLLQVF